MRDENIVRRWAVALFSIASLVTFVLTLTIPTLWVGRWAAVGVPFRFQTTHDRSQRFSHPDVLGESANGAEDAASNHSADTIEWFRYVLAGRRAIELVHTELTLWHIPGLQDATIDGPEGRDTAHIAEGPRGFSIQPDSRRLIVLAVSLFCCPVTSICVGSIRATI